MILQSAATGVKKLLVDDKITACVKEICLLLDVVCKVSNRKTLSGETFCFPEKGLLSILNLVLRVTYLFFELLIGRDDPLSWNALLFSCNPIGQLCLSSPDYSYCSRTVKG